MQVEAYPKCALGGKAVLCTLYSYLNNKWERKFELYARVCSLGDPEHLAVK